MNKVTTSRIRSRYLGAFWQRVGTVFGMAMAIGVESVALGNINLDLRPLVQAVEPGDEVRIGLYAVSDSDVNQFMSAADVILGWNPNFLRLLVNDNTGAVPLMVSGFPSIDPYHLNETTPPQDGDGLYLAYAYGGQPVAATPSGALLTTLRFTALAETTATEVLILPSAGSPVGHTVVYSGAIPGLDVTGTLGVASIVIRNCGHGDIDNDGDTDMVDANLFVAVLLGLDTNPAHVAAADLDCSGIADGLDIQPFINLLLTP
jgi:hypothetical protein